MTSTDQLQRRSGTAIFSYGFRPFFLFGAAWAALSMLLWLAMLIGVADVPTRLDPVSWHAHEFLFGYLSAIVAGFLLTAVPNWTGRPALAGWPLVGLFTVWVVGRVLLALSALVPLGLPETVDLMFPVFLGTVILREIIAGQNWRNLVVVLLLAVFTFGNLLFHIEAAQDAFAAQGMGLRIGVAAVLIMISVIGGRIVPTFTRNWLVKTGQKDLPTPPMQTFDKVTLLATVGALALWVALPLFLQTGFALIAIGLLHVVRLVRWKGYHTLSEPLLWVLHLGYLCVPLGALIEGFAILEPDVLAPGSAQHVWMAGAFGLMTLAVMTRATLGHTGQQLAAGPGSVMIFLCVIGSVVIRIAAGLWPVGASFFYTVSAMLWIAAFAGFVAIYGAVLVKPPAAPDE